MSLILEALKKSEAERQLGRAPGLMTPMPGRTRRRRGAWIWAIVALALVGTAAGVLWFVSRASEPGRSMESVVVPDPPPPATTVPEPITAPRPADTPAIGATPEATQAIRSAPPASTTAARPVVEDGAPPAPLPRDPEFDSIERESIALAARIPPPPVAPRVAPPPPGTAALPPTAEASAAADSADPLARFDQLMPEVRDALPPLKQSMHVFAEVEGDRFVLIDGRRYRQGERIAPSLTIVAIRRDGTELDFDGRRFLLPRP